MYIETRFIKVKVECHAHICIFDRVQWVTFIDLNCCILIVHELTFDVSRAEDEFIIRV